MRTYLTNRPLLFTPDGVLEWNRNKDKTHCTFYHEEKTYQGTAIRKHSDQYDFIFGMKQSLANMFKNSKLPKDIRTTAWTIFRGTYGDGVCEQIPTEGEGISLLETLKAHLSKINN